MKTVTIGERKYHLPYWDLIPFDARQLADLGTSIEEVGAVLVPIVCWKEKKTDTTETVVDGAHRVIEAARIGLKKIPVQWRSFASEAEARAECERLNHDRRQMSNAELETRRQARIQRVAERRQAGESQRQIAKEEGISQTQVKKDIEAATEQGCSVEPPEGKVTGLDGRQQPATREKPTIFCERCTRVGPVKNCPACAELKAKPKRQPKTGKPIYDDRIIAKLLGSMARELHKRSEVHGGETAHYKDCRKCWEDLNTAFKRWQLHKEKK